MSARWPRALACAACVAIASASPARADGAEGVAVRPFDGPGGRIVRRHVVRVVEREAADGSFAGIVEGRVDKRGQRWRVTVWARAAEGAERVQVAQYTGRRASALTQRIRADLWNALEPALRSAEAKPADEPRVVEEPPAPAATTEQTKRPSETEPVAEPVSQATSPGARPSALDLELGAGGFSRRLDFVDDVRGELSEYRLRFGPAIAARARWYPGAHFTDGPLAHLGLGMRFEHAVGVGSRTPDGEPFDTKALEIDVEARGRVPIGAHAITPFVGWGRQLYRVQPASPAGPRGTEQRPAVPGVDYRYVRFGLDLRVQADRLAIEAGAAWRQVLSAGAIDTWFRGLDVGAFDAEVRIAYRVHGGLAVRLGVHLRRYFLSMSPEPGDDRVAGGAVDQYVGSTLSIAWRDGGKP